jgi:exodeoxyribonuclease VII large subunit
MFSVVSARIRRERTELRGMPARLARLASQRIQQRRAELGACAAGLNALSPLSVLGRGYAVARRIDGVALTSARQFVPNLDFELLLRDGRARARTTDAEPIVEGK